MNKAELIDAVAAGADISKAAAGRALDTLVQTIATSLGKGEDVSVVGFGTFTTTDRAARTGRNPQTGAEIKIAASKAPKFKPGSVLKEAVAK